MRSTAGLVPGRKYDFRQSRRWRKLRKRILARDGWRCHWCGSYADQVDHVRPVQQGGDRWDESNLVAADGCNQRRGAKGGVPTPPQAERRSVFSRRDVNTCRLDAISLPTSRSGLIRGDYSRRRANDGAA